MKEGPNTHPHSDTCGDPGGPGTSKHLEFAERDTAEWGRVWGMLREDDQDTVRDNQGEVWEYMGTVVCPTDGVREHQFRHRMHPVTHEREYRFFQERMEAE